MYIHTVMGVAVALTVLQLVGIRTGGDPVGHPERPPAGRGSFPAVHAVALGGITFHVIIIFFMLSSTKCFLN